MDHACVRILMENGDRPLDCKSNLVKPDVFITMANHCETSVKAMTGQFGTVVRALHESEKLCAIGCPALMFSTARALLVMA